MEWDRYEIDYKINKTITDEKVSFLNGVTVNGKKFISQEQLRQALGELKSNNTYLNDDTGERECLFTDVELKIGRLCK